MSNLRDYNSLIDTDPIWAAAGDLLQGTGNDAGEVLSIGTAYQIPSVNAGATALEYVTDRLSPWLIDIDAFTTPGAQTNWATLSVSETRVHCAAMVSSGGQNSEISWPIVLSAGTWTFSLLHLATPSKGIFSVQLDTVEQGTIDSYNAGSVDNVLSTITGISIAAPGKKTLRLLMATKNVSSSGYNGAIQTVRMIRTA